MSEKKQSHISSYRIFECFVSVWEGGVVNEDFHILTVTS